MAKEKNLEACASCGGTMLPAKQSRTVKNAEGKKVKTSVDAQKCASCGYVHTAQ